MRIEAYKEACSFARHYSNACRSVRLLCIAQGMAVLSVSGLLAREKLYSAAAIFAFFGVLLGITLFFVHRGYLGATQNFYSAAQELEEPLEGQGPVCIYLENYIPKSKGWRSVAMNEGPLILIVLSCLGSGCWALSKCF